MSDGTEFQDIQETPQESEEVAEARQELDRATLEPAAAVEKAVEIKTAEAVENAVKEAVEAGAAVAATEDGGRGTGEAAVSDADGGPGTGDRVEADASTEDRRPGTENQQEAERAARAEYAQDTEAATREGTSVDLEDSFDLNAEEVKEIQDTSSAFLDEEAEAVKAAEVDTGPNEETTLEDDRLPGQTDLADSKIPVERTSPVDHITDALDTAGDQVGDFRVPTKHPQQVEPLPDRDPSGESAQIPGDPSDLELREEQERPSYDPDLEPEPAGAAGEAPSEGSSSQSEAGAETTGKAALGEPAADPVRSYTGVEMSQGEVAQDSDWNEGSGVEDEMVLETDPAREGQAGLPKFLADSSFQIADQLEDSAEGSGKLTLGDLVLSVLPWPFHKDLPDNYTDAEEQDGMYNSLSVPGSTTAGQDTTTETEEDHDVQYAAFPMPDGTKVEVKAIPLPDDISMTDDQSGEADDDDDSQIGDTSAEAHLGDIQPTAPERLPQDASQDASLPNQDLQNQLQRQQQLVGMLSQISKLVHDTENAVIRNADGGSTQIAAEGTAESEDPMAAQAEGALQEIGNQAQLEMMDLQNALQRQQQTIQLMSNLSKMMEDTAMSVIRNIGGDEETTQDDPEQPGDSDQDQGTSLEAVLADQSERGDLSNLTVSLEDSMQKQGQFLMIISNILKNLDDVDQAIINNMRGAEGQEGEDLGASGDTLHQELEEWEEQLSTIGDDAQLTEVDLSSFLDKQQNTIDMLSGMTKTLTDTTSVVAQKMGLTQPPAVEDAAQETSTQQSSLQEEMAKTSEDWRTAAESNMIADPGTGETIGPLEDQNEDTQEGSTSAGSDQGSGTDELMDRLGNLEATRHRLEMDINSLRDFIAHTPEGQFQNLLIHLPVPDGQGGYRLVPLQIPGDINIAANLLAQQEGVLSQIMAEIAQVQGQLEDGPSGPPAQVDAADRDGGAGANWQDAAQDNNIEDPRPNSGPDQAG